MLDPSLVDHVESYCCIMLSRIREFADLIARDLANGIPSWSTDGPHQTVLSRWGEFQARDGFYSNGLGKLFTTPASPDLDSTVLHLMRLPDCQIRIAGTTARNAHELVMLKLSSVMLANSSSLSQLNGFITDLEGSDLASALRREADWLRINAAPATLDIPIWLLCAIFNVEDARTVKKKLGDRVRKVGQTYRVPIYQLPDEWLAKVKSLQGLGGKRLNQKEQLIRNAESHQATLETCTKLA